MPAWQATTLKTEPHSNTVTSNTQHLRIQEILRLLCQLLGLIIWAAVIAPLLPVGAGILPSVSAKYPGFNCAHISFNLTIGIMNLAGQGMSCHTVCTEKIGKLEGKIGKGRRYYSDSIEDAQTRFENPTGHRFVDVCSVTNRLCTGKHWIADTNDFALAGIGSVSAGQSCFAPGATSYSANVPSSCRSPRLGLQDDNISCICAITLHLYLVHLGWYEVPKSSVPYALQAGREYFNGSHADCHLAAICQRLSVKYRDLGNWICDNSPEHMLIDQVLPCKPSYSSKWWPDYLPKNRCICNTGGQRNCRELIQFSGTRSEEAYEWVMRLPEAIIKFAQARETILTTTDVLSWLPREFDGAIADEYFQGHFPTGNYLSSHEEITTEVGPSGISNLFSLVTDIDSLFEPCISTLWESAPQRRSHEQFEAGTSQGPLFKKGRYEHQSQVSATVGTSPVVNAAESETLNSITCQSTAKGTVPPNMSDAQWVDEYLSISGD